MAPLELKGNTFDPAAEKQPNQDATKTNYILVEAKGPLKKEDYDELDKLKVMIEEYVGKETYLVRYEPTDLKPIEKLGFVKNVTVYPVKVKIAPDLLKAVEEAGQGKEPQKHPVGVHLHEGIAGGVQKILDQVAAFTKPVILAQNPEVILMIIELKFVHSVAAIDGVRSIGLEYPPQPEAVIARQIMKVDPGKLWSNNETLTGAGQVITVADSGFDKGNPAQIHPDFQGRLKSLLPVGRPNGLTNDTTGHGTHVAGCAVGSKTGSAPGAELVVQSLWDPVNKGFVINDRRTRIEEAIAQGSYIQNCSFGNKSNNDLYNGNAHDADHAMYTNPQFIVCNAAGNDGDAKGHVNDVGCSKNSITVGASMNTRPLNGSSYDEKGTPGKPGDMIDWSNPGPAHQGRIKPDVVAPGVVILSTASQDPEFQNGFVEGTKLFGTKTKLIDSKGKAPNELYCYSSGTSMATPLVSGCLAIVRQALARYKANATPNASLVKALIIHGATDIGTGRYHSKPIGAAPNAVQGHGLVDMERSLAPVLDTARTLHGIWEDSVTVPLEPKVLMIKSPPLTAGKSVESYSLTVTLVYTDFPGRELQSELVLYITPINHAKERSEYWRAPYLDNVYKGKIEKIWDNMDVEIKIFAGRLFRGREQKFSVVWSFQKN